MDNIAMTQSPDVKDRAREICAQLIPHTTSVHNVDLIAQAMIRAASSPWQPIDTAPKDGTIILAWSRYMEICTVQWIGKEFAPVCDGSQVLESEGDWGSEYKYVGLISHWMPLPNKPAGGEG